MFLDYVHVSDIDPRVLALLTLLNNCIFQIQHCRATQLEAGQILSVHFPECTHRG